MSVASASASTSQSQIPHPHSHLLYKHIDAQRAELQRRETHAKFELSLALGAGLSILLFNFSKELGFFGPSTPASELTLGALVSVLALVVLYYTGGNLRRALLTSGRELELSFETAQAAALAALVGGAVYAGFYLQDGGLLAHFANLTSLVLLLLCVDRMLNDMLLRRVLEGIGMRLGASKNLPKKGERFTVRRGEAIPCDAVVLEGVAELAERKFAAFNRIRFASSGSEVFAGSHLSAGTLTCQALSDPEDSFMGVFQAHLDGLVNHEIAQAALDKIMRAENFILQITLFAAACAGIYWHGQGATFLEQCLLCAAVFLCGGVLRVWRLALFARGLTLSSLYRNGVVLRLPEVLDNLPLVSSLVLDQPERNGEIRVKKLELIDDRYEKERVLSAAVILAASSDHPQFIQLTGALCELCSEREIFESSDIHCYDDRGVLGLIQGVEFSLGSEDFLIERGIYLEVSEILQPSPGEKVFYLAIKDQVIARLLFVLRDFSLAAEELVQIEAAGVRVVACSPLPYEEFKDTALDKLRMEPKDLFADFSLARLREKLVSLRPVALLSYALSPGQIERFADVAFVPFDELLCSFERADVTLCNSKLDGIARALKGAKRLLNIKRQNLYLGAGAGFVLLVCTLMGLAGPVLAIVLSSSIAILAAANLLRLR